MVSRRNFFSICIMMGVLFFMFQFLQVFKESGNATDTNAHIQEIRLSGSAKWQADAAKVSEKDLIKDGFEKNGYVLFVGSKDSAVGGIVSQWCEYTKRKLTVISQVQAVSAYGDDLPEFLLIDSETVDFDKQTESFAELAKEGVCVIFCNLPSPTVINNNETLKKMLGVRKVADDSVDVEGIRLFPGLLFGGEGYYKVDVERDEEKQDMDLSIPWYYMGKGTKVYMVGILDEDEVEREKFPPLLWRCSYDGTPVFAVNGDFFSGLEGLGILDSFVYEAKPYSIYPVINARNTFMTGCPSFTDENSEVMQELYSREVTDVYRDIMWSGICAMTKEKDLKMSFFMMPKYNYDCAEEPSGDDRTFYLQQMREFDAEAGLSLVYEGDISLADKLEQDKVFWDSLKSPYRFAAYYCGAEVTAEMEEAMKNDRLPDIRTYACDYNSKYPLVSYYNDEVTLQCITQNSLEYTYTDDLRQRGIETSLGYSNVEIPMQNIMYPETSKDRWENYFEKISSNVSTYYSSFKVFEPTTLSESDARIRSFLNLDYAQKREEDKISLKVSGMGKEAWFILRTHGEEIKEIEGASYEKIEEDAYLIQVVEELAEIQLGVSEEQVDYYFREEAEYASAWRN